MTQQRDRPAQSGRWTLPQLRVGAVVAVAVAAGLVVWLVVGRDHGGSKQTAAPARAATAQDLRALSASLRRPIYWAGPRAGYTYELTQTTDGRIYVRYLPAGTPLRDSHALFLTVGTYPMRDASAAVAKIGRQPDAATFAVPGGGTAAADPAHPTNVYLAFGSSNAQIEVFDPSPGRARQLVESGRIAAVGSTSTANGAPAIATIEQIRALGSSVGHPVYWAGPRRGIHYELTQLADGRIYVRYLPLAASAGDSKRYLTVGTYPVPDSLAAARDAARRNHVAGIPLTGGGIAVVDRAHPTSVYVGLPGSDFQIEVFAPSPAAARRLVTSGSIVPIS